MISRKRIFNLEVANYLIENGVNLLEVRTGEVADNSHKPTFLFEKGDQLTKALLSWNEKKYGSSMHK